MSIKKPVIATGGGGLTIISSDNIIGGHHEVATIAERDAIPVEMRREGMSCTVLDDGTGKPATYQLIGGTSNANWEVLTGGVQATWGGEYPTYAALAAEAAVYDGFSYVVTADENHGGARTYYTYKQGTGFVYMGAFSDGMSSGGTTGGATSAAVASAPGFFRRDIPFAKSSSSNTVIVTPNRLWVNIGVSGYALDGQQALDLTQYMAWDTRASAWQPSTAYAVNDCIIPPAPNGYIYRCVTAGVSSSSAPSFPTTLGQTCNDGSVVWICQLDFTVAANRMGKDFYIYACQPASGSVPVFMVSDNSTVPLRYNAINSRKVGGFHCLCANVGTINGHTLSGYLAGDILPASVWDLNHRPVSDPEGMVYDANTDRWVDIYLSSVQNGQLASVYNGVIADGASSPAFHWYKSTDWMIRVKKNLLTQRQFVSASLGSNQGTNIAGAADPNTTGGHSDTTGRRMISNIGCEDMCGAIWQWGCEGGGPYASSAYQNAFDANDINVGGKSAYTPSRVLFGGAWTDGLTAGSRSSYWNTQPLFLHPSYALRGCAEPLRGI